MVIAQFLLAISSMHELRAEFRGASISNQRASAVKFARANANRFRLFDSHISFAKLAFAI
ncbi:MAG: hypothetical protein ACHQAY_25500 [Hyphomicrobiales bacterium]